MSAVSRAAGDTTIAAAGKLVVESGAGVRDSLRVFGAEIVNGALLVNGGVSSAGGLLLSHGSVHVDGEVELYGATRAGSTFLSGGMLVSRHGLLIGHSVRIEGFGGFASGRMGLAASGGLNASRGTSFLVGASQLCIAMTATLLSTTFAARSGNDTQVLQSAGLHGCPIASALPGEACMW